MFSIKLKIAKYRMKKFIIITFLFIYVGSFIKPFAPAIFNYISKKVWEYSHTNHVEEINGRVNILSVLADMAKHNNPNDDTTPAPDVTKSAGSSFVCIVPNLYCSFSGNDVLKKYFSQYIFNNQIVFKQNTTPPPKSA